jgi:hypothetical protein
MRKEERIHGQKKKPAEPGEKVDAEVRKIQANVHTSYNGVYRNLTPCSVLGNNY